MNDHLTGPGRKLVTKADIFSVLLCLGAILPGVLIYGRLPDRIVTNFDLSGEPANYSSKAFTVFGIPLIIAALQLILCIATNFFFSGTRSASSSREVPADPEREHESGKDRINAFVRFMMPLSLYIALIMIFLYSLELLRDVLAVTGCLFAFICIVTGNYMPKLRRNFLIGIRIPRTLADQEIWDMTHRFAGGLYIFGGILAIPVTLAGKYPALFAIVVLLLVIPIIYSEAVWRSRRKKAADISKTET